MSRKKPFQIRDSMESLRILVDTREQDTERARERYNSFLCDHNRAKLEYGDYAANFLIDDELWFFHQTTEEEKIYPFPAVIERKMNLDELCNCFCRERDRFQRELERAKGYQSRTYLLVENATWEKILAHDYRSRMLPKALMASILAWQVRYDFRVIFCESQTTGTLIYHILYREVKEFLEQTEMPELYQEFHDNYKSANRSLL